MRPFETADSKTLQQIRGVCFDIDDTFSSHGKITDLAYQALWNLKRAGFFLVPVTGRPAGWCDHIVRFWPVDAVIGENGAFVFYMENGVRKRLDTMGPLPELPTGEVFEHQKKLACLKQKILKQFPHARVASDQAYRDYDLAIDICEDVPAWKPQSVNELLELCHSEGAHAKLSSIHVNTWFGEFDKKRGFENWHSLGTPGLNSKLTFNEWIYMGDSPNDEPLFGFFEKSVGVANLKQFELQLKSPPLWITKLESGQGFKEVADRLISERV